MQNPEISDLLGHGPIKAIHVVPVTENFTLVGWRLVAVFFDGYKTNLSAAQEDYIKNNYIGWN